MGGIFGYIDLTKHISAEEGKMITERGTLALSHRGPNFGNSFFDQKCHFGMGHRRLATIDLLSRANSPYQSQSKKSVLSFDGEIYNFNELKSQLNNIPFLTTSDSEVLVEALEKWDVSALPMLNGTFAFIFYQRVSHKIILAVDPLGKKPIYIYQNKQVIAFASEIKALKKIPHIPFTIDNELLKQFLIYGYIPGQQTIFKEVTKVPAAHYQIIDLDLGILEPAHRYWNLPKSTHHQLKYGDAKQELKQRIQMAVKRRLLSDVPLGSLLSGGLNSSIISYEAAQIIQPQSLTTIHNSLRNSSLQNESSIKSAQHAQHIADVIFSRHSLVDFELDIQSLSKRMSHFDEPFADSSLLFFSTIYEHASQNFKVALSGDGSQDIFGGSTLLRAGLINEKYRNMLKVLLEPKSLGPTLPFVNQFRKILKQAFPERILFWTHFFTEDDYQKFISKETNDFYSEYEYWKNELQDLPPEEKALQFHFRTKLYSDLLQKMDRTSMQFGLQIRCPFLDKDLIDFAFTLPASFKFDFFQSQKILKDIYFPLFANKDSHSDSYSGLFSGLFSIQPTNFLASLRPLLNTSLIESQKHFPSLPINTADININLSDSKKFVLYCLELFLQSTQETENHFS